ncbi:helix-turn-helix domain-containing protein [Gordonia sp. HNM0687]|uniref:Helix-turn-helix domain-containing protein n=1 Tax=Gordonia mangrovi TaxID=2665643 RepID=A0A6L7GRF3_9ACTN|nr:helix-turn-helix transcriptional regulator [Gordonia mangrovi]MXP22153.1 helix-turn-helix domain-containing protein [Gordonia mangrovi]UVF77938.1 helix-turn-helix transcriptional regulator [Gordonia mangrovi]
MTAAVGSMLRQWRSQRSMSQLDLAYEVGVSPKHLSFVETGKSTPSAGLIEALSVRLEIPLRERNALLLAAGHAPRYSEQSLDAAAMVRVRASLQRVLDAHHPFPGLALDRAWNVVVANESARTLAAMLPPHLTGPPFNLFRASLHPDGFARITANFDIWASYLLTTLRRLVGVTGDPRLIGLEHEVAAYPTVSDLDQRGVPRGAPEPDLLVPFSIRVGDDVLSFFTTLTTFGSPRDITLEEMTIELFYPADEVTERAVARRHR